MRSNIYNIFRLSAAILTVLFLALHKNLPKREYSLIEEPSMHRWLYSETSAEGVSEIAWKDSAKTQWFCDHKAHSRISCGMSVSLLDNQTGGIDFSNFDGIVLKASYKGNGDRIRFYLRNINPKYYTHGDDNSGTFTSRLIKTSEFSDGRVYIDFKQLIVAEWWALQFNIDPEDIQPKFNNIRTVGLDILDPGHAELTINDIVFVGDRVKTQTVYLALVALWLTIVIIESLGFIYRLYQESKQRTEEISELQTMNSRLTEAHYQLTKKVGLDKLTGILNRDGFDDLSRKIFAAKDGVRSLGLLVLDIDHFKKINDIHGHDIGDQILREFATVVLASLRRSDIFARWGGEEFVIMYPNIPHDRLSLVAEIVNRSVADFAFLGNRPFSVTVSIGVAYCNRGTEDFDSLFKRADAALYNAKANGRNRVEYAE